MKLLVAVILGATMNAGPADLVIVNAKVRTMDPSRATAEAVAVTSNRITQVGSNADINKLAGAQTRIIDVGGRLVLPGFNDAHVHFLSGGFDLSGIHLREAKTPEEFARLVGEFAKKLPRERWITGGDWDHERWPSAPLPTKELIDPVTPNTPVFVSRLDGHMALANSLALKLGGVTADTKDPPGGTIVRDPKTGQPTGILKDAAMGFVSAKIPAPSRAEKLEAAKAATAHAASLGVTSLQDMSSGPDVAVYQALLERGELKTRIYAMLPLVSYPRTQPSSSPIPLSSVLHVGGLKGFSDGSLGSSTAWFFEPYEGSAMNVGLPADEMFPEGAMLDRVKAADRAGLQVMVHAIGDRANFRSLLDAGVILAFGSDWTVAPLDPMQGIAAAVTRQTLDGKNPRGWIPEQKITVDEAVRAYTVGSAYAEFAEKEKGSITPSKLADFVILSQNIFEIPPEKISRTKVLWTIMDGQIVYSHAEQSWP